MKKIMIWILAIIILLAVIPLSYIHLAYGDVDRELRVRGFIYDKFNSANDVESLRKSSESEKIPKVKTDKDVRVEKKTIQTRTGKEVKVIIYRSAKEEKTDENRIPGFLWLHGGGYAKGSPEAEFDQAKEFLQTAHSVIISPDYTKSVEVPYPAALHDAYETLIWMKEHADDLGINKDQLFVGGNSAGGGLAVATTLYARDHHEVNIAYKFPLYPMMNDQMNTPSAIDNHAFIWDTDRSIAAWKLYLGDIYGTDQVPTYAAPSREKDYSNLPPTFTYIGDLDPFYDDTINYVKDLRDEGVDVEFYTYKGAYHGFVGVAPQAKISKEAQAELLKAYKYAVEHCFAEQDS